MITIKVKKITRREDKMRGLIGVKPYAVFFHTRLGIHTFGMREAVDILVLDKNNRVVKMYKKLSPNRVFLWNPKFDRVVELPQGLIAKNYIKVGSRINLI